MLDWAIRVWNPDRDKIVFSKMSRPALEAHSASYSVGTRVLNGGGGLKRSGYDVDHSPPPSTEVKNWWSYTSTPPVCIDSLNREIFTF